MILPQPRYTLFPYTTLFRSPVVFWIVVGTVSLLGLWSAATATYFAFRDDVLTRLIADRKSTRLNSSHVEISYAVFCLKKKILIIGLLSVNQCGILDISTKTS